MTDQSIVIQGNTITRGKGIRIDATDEILMHGNTFITTPPNTFKRLFNYFLGFWATLVQLGKNIHGQRSRAGKCPKTPGEIVIGKAKRCGSLNDYFAIRKGAAFICVAVQADSFVGEFCVFK